MMHAEGRTIARRINVHRIIVPRKCSIELKGGISHAKSK